MTNIRNFAIIAHIDHGKSTLADRLIEYCGTLKSHEMKHQILDSMDIERERGITIKAQTVRLPYKADNGQEYILNLMDTPGHVDFTYEVSRCLAACEGSLLVVDSTQGVEAQTLANVYQAIENDHVIIPVLNKIDLPSSDVDGVKQQIEDVIGIDTSHSVLVSAKTGHGIKDLLEAIVTILPPPQSTPKDAPLKALLIDSWYDPYLGVIILLRIMEGVIEPGMKIYMMKSQTTQDVEQIGIFTPKKEYVKRLSAGEVGFITAGIKQISDCKIGDTITQDKKRATAPLAGFKPLAQVVFCGIFPLDSSEFPVMRDSLDKLNLNDSSFSYEPESSQALGHGFRCGFLGLLHLEIIQERLQREFSLEILTTVPSVVYRLNLTNGDVLELHNPAEMPDIVRIKEIEEPWIEATIMVPEDYLGSLLELCTQRRGVQKNLHFFGKRAVLTYDLPLNEIIFDFYDKLKSLSRGYASFEYHLKGYREGDLVKLNIMVNGEIVDALSMMVHRSTSEKRGRALCLKLKDLLPKQLFKIAIQAAIGGKVIARETVSAMRKDVTAKCYGGDITRKRKLLEKQKEGKKKMRQYGNVDIPQKVFVEVLKIDT